MPNEASLKVTHGDLSTRLGSASERRFIGPKSRHRPVNFTEALA